MLVAKIQGPTGALDVNFPFIGVYRALKLRTWNRLKFRVAVKNYFRRFDLIFVYARDLRHLGQQNCFRGLICSGYRSQHARARMFQ